MAAMGVTIPVDIPKAVWDTVVMEGKTMVDVGKVRVGDLIGYKGHEYKVREGAELKGKRYFVVRTHNTKRLAWIPVEKVESHTQKEA